MPYATPHCLPPEVRLFLNDGAFFLSKRVAYALTTISSPGWRIRNRLALPLNHASTFRVRARYLMACPDLQDALLLCELFWRLHTLKQADARRQNPSQCLRCPVLDGTRITPPPSPIYRIGFTDLQNQIRTVTPDLRVVLCISTDASEENWARISQPTSPAAELEKPLFEQTHQLLAFLSGTISDCQEH